jgi:hypothetical protein
MGEKCEGCRREKERDRKFRMWKEQWNTNWMQEEEKREKKVQKK